MSMRYEKCKPGFFRSSRLTHFLAWLLSLVFKVLLPELCMADCRQAQSKMARLRTLKLLLHLLAVLFLPCEPALLRSEGVSKLLNDVLSLVHQHLVESDVLFSCNSAAKDAPPGLDWTRPVSYTHLTLPTKREV